MNHRTLTCALGLAAFALTGAPLEAHGGIYRGPGDVVPPGGGSGPRGSGPRTGGPRGPRTGQPAGPSAPAPSGPATGGPGRGPSGGSPSGGRTGGGVQLSDDLTNWTFWWEFNKHAYIGLREAVHESGPTTGTDAWWLGRGSATRPSNLLEPTSKQIHNDILPTLKRAIDSTEQRDIVSSCMVAMAKIGEDHQDFSLVDVFRPRLSRDNQEIRETAALSLGISAVDDEDALQLLIDLSLDNAAARKVRGGAIGIRTRSFALYGLGLYANDRAALAIKKRAFESMRTVLLDKSARSRNLKVAAIQGMGMLALDHSDAGNRALVDEALDVLVAYYDKPSGGGTQTIQSHCPTAITKLLGKDHPRTDEFLQRFAEELDGKNRRRRNHNLAQSCVLALGQLCEPNEDMHSRDRGYSDLLVKTFQQHKDGQTRYFALIALGQIGGKINRDYLLRILRKGRKSLERPWAAIALGVQAFETYRAQKESQDTIKIDEMVGAALQEQLKQAKSPMLVGALGVALGLVRCQDAAEAMRERMQSELQKDEQAGYLCLGLALMRNHGSMESIRKTMLASTRRTNLFVQSAIALGLLGDKSAAEELHRKLDDENSNLATLAAIASALGQIGDRRSVDPLKNALFDEERGDLQRAFAAVGLGAVADRAMLPWHAEISTNINYRAAVETLTNQQSGVLDIL